MDIRDRAVGYINIKPRTEAQLRRYLTSKKYEESEIDQVISELKEYHYIDDLQYAKMYLEYGYEKGRGDIRIRQELREKGVDNLLIQQAFDEAEDLPDEREIARNIAISALSGTDPDGLEHAEREKLKARIARRLASRGFNSEIVYGVLREIGL